MVSLLGVVNVLEDMAVYPIIHTYIDTYIRTLETQQMQLSQLHMGVYTLLHIVSYTLPKGYWEPEPAHQQHLHVHLGQICSHIVWCIVGSNTPHACAGHAHPRRHGRPHGCTPLTPAAESTAENFVSIAVNRYQHTPSVQTHYSTSIHSSWATVLARPIVKYTRPTPI